MSIVEKCVNQLHYKNGANLHPEELAKVKEVRNSAYKNNDLPFKELHVVEDENTFAQKDLQSKLKDAVSQEAPEALKTEKQHVYEGVA